MKHNVGGLDKKARILVGILLLSLLVLLPSPNNLWGLIGLVPLATGTFGFCPLYTVLGLTTCPLKDQKK